MFFIILEIIKYRLHDYKYKYNYFGKCVLPKYNILELMNNNPFVVTGITSVVNTKTLAAALQILKVRERL